MPRLCIQTEFLPVYQQQLKDMIIDQVDMKGPARDRPLEGLKVVVNAGNGNGGFLAESLSEVRTVHMKCFVVDHMQLMSCDVAGKTRHHSTSSANLPRHSSECNLNVMTAKGSLDSEGSYLRR